MHLRISGNLGGEAELKVHPATGALVQVIVISAPPQGEATAMRVVEEDSHCVVPIIDTFMGGTRSAGMQAQQDSGGLVIAVVAPMAFEYTDKYMRLSLADTVPSKFLRCGKVRVGISEMQELVTFEASL